MWSLIFACFYLCLCMFFSACEELMVHPGETVLLPCLFLEAASILMMKVVKWDVQGPGYCFYSDGQPRESYQHPSFKNRVDPKDPRMENGDCSVFLRNVSLNDTGTYVFVVGYKTAGSNDTGTFKHLNHLTVKDAHVPDRGHTGLIPPSVPLPVLLSILLPLLLFLCC